MPKRTKKQKYPPQKVLHEGQPVHIKHQITAQNFSQELYLSALRESIVTLGLGPAGVGKTYIVTAVALEKLLAGDVKKIVLTRPVVEADESLGFLPGSLEEKLDPYLRPLFDAIQDHVGIQMAQRLLETKKIEIAPLAFMRGRTFNNSFVILDEAQNSTVKQMKMFLTRVGTNSIYSINGDLSQSDLQRPKNAGENWENGLQYAYRKLRGRDENISCVEFQNRDVVRSEIAKKIVALLDAPDNFPEEGRLYQGS